MLFVFVTRRIVKLANDADLGIERNVRIMHAACARLGAGIRMSHFSHGIICSFIRFSIRESANIFMPLSTSAEAF